MKIRFDEHVSEKIVGSINELTLIPNLEISSIYSASQRGFTDFHWATQFSKEGGDAIITADTDFFKRHHLVVAIQETGLKVIHLRSQWANSRFTLQAAFLLLWWDRIYDTLEACNQRELYQVPWQFGLEAKLIKKPLDFQNARKKVKTADRRNPNRKIPRQSP